MRILLVTGSYPPMKCGVGDYTAALAEALQQDGHEVGILTGANAEPPRETHRITVFPVINSWNWRERRIALQVIQQWRADIVHIQHPTLGYAGGDLPWRLPFALALRRIPIIQTWHEFLPDAGQSFRANFTMAISPGPVIVVRPQFRMQMPQWFRLFSARKKITHIPNAPTIPRMVLTPEQRTLIRDRYLRGGSRLIVFFGFLYEHKGIDDLLEILDPNQDRLLLIGEVKEWDPYQTQLLKRLATPRYASLVELTGYLPGETAGSILAAADAIALPYRKGGGSWNTALHAAVLQGTFVLTTSLEQHGFDVGINTYYARPGDVEDLRVGLQTHTGQRPEQDSSRLPTSWQQIAQRHVDMYREQIR